MSEMELLRTVRLFGKVALEGSPGREIPLVRGKMGELLAYVATRPDETIARDQAAAVLWPDGDLHESRNRLNVTQFRLKNIMGGELPFEADRQVFQSSGEALRCDVVEFRRLARRASQTGEPTKKAALLIEALSWVRGVFMPGHDAPWVLYERRRIEQETGNALSHALTIMGDPADGQAMVLRLLGAADALPLTTEVEAALAAPTFARLGPLVPKPVDGRTVWDAMIDFDRVSNPNGAWSYGWAWEIGAEFIPYRERGTVSSDGNETSTMRTTAWPNPSAGRREWIQGTIMEGHSDRLLMTPGVKGQKAIVRWKAPARGAYRIDALFSGVSTAETCNTTLLANDCALVSDLVRYDRPDVRWSGIVVFEPGSMIEVVVGGDGGFHRYGVELGLTIRPASSIGEARFEA